MRRTRSSDWRCTRTGDTNFPRLAGRRCFGGVMGKMRTPLLRVFALRRHHCTSFDGAGPLMQRTRQIFRSADACLAGVGRSGRVWRDWELMFNRARHSHADSCRMRNQCSAACMAAWLACIQAHVRTCDCMASHAQPQTD